MKKYSMVLVAVFLFAGASILFVSTFYMRTLFLAPIGPGFVPRLVAGSMAILSVLLFVFELRKTATYVPEEKPREENDKPKPHKYAALITLLLLGVYIALLRHLGFILSSTFYLAVQINILYGRFSPKRVSLFLAGSFVFSAAIYGIFVFGFSIMLPIGILG